MTDWHLSAAARTSRGLVRARNMDGFFLDGRSLQPEEMNHGGGMWEENDAPSQLYAVCDGLGSDATGQWASYEITRLLQMLRDAYPDGMTDSEALFSVGRLSDRIHRLAGTDRPPTGAALAMCLWLRGTLRVLNVGNCRVYRLRAGKLTQLSVDHTETQRMIDLGMETPYLARMSPRRHLLTQYVGMDSGNRAFQPALSAVLAVRPRDRYLLCTDGLYDMVEDEEIRKTLLRARDAAEAAERLVQQALDNGGRDNATVVCLTVHGYRRVWRLRQG